MKRNGASRPVSAVFSLAHTGQLALLRYFLNGIAFNGEPKA